MKFRKFGTALAALTLMMALVPATQAQITPPTTPITRDSSHSGCYDLIATNRWTGTSAVVSNSGNARGVSALIRIENTINGWAECTTGVGNDGPLAWVALTPAPDNSLYGSFDAIVQIGLINCNSIGYSVCSASRTYEPRFFYAAAGCASWPHPLDLGQANVWTNYRFSIRRYVDTTQGHAYGGQYLSLKINGVEKKRIWYDDSRVKCWIDQDKQADWYTETFDAGDTVGEFDLNPFNTKITGAYFRDIDWYINSTWYKVNNAPCLYKGPSNTIHPLGCITSTPSNGDGDTIYTYSLN